MELVIYVGSAVGYCTGNVDSASSLGLIGYIGDCYSESCCFVDTGVRSSVCCCYCCS